MPELERSPEVVARIVISFICACGMLCYTFLPLDLSLFLLWKTLCVMQEVSSCTIGHKPTRPRLQKFLSKNVSRKIPKGPNGERVSITITGEDEPPPSNVVNFSAGKMETFSSSNLYQSSSSSSIVLWSGSVAWLVLGWKTLFLTNPM